MRSFDFYEFAGIVVPGTILLVGAAICSQPVKHVVFDGGLSVGEATLSLIAAYGIGHLVQALGNLIEWIWWGAWGGMPSDWPRSGQRPLLSNRQKDSLEAALSGELHINVNGGIGSLSSRDWHPVVRQVYAAVAGAGRANRIDIFNGNYGLNRGLAAALVTVVVVALLTQGWAAWKAAILLFTGAGVATYRMHRFGVHYARELFVQFLQLTPTEGGPPEGLKE